MSPRYSSVVTVNFVAVFRENQSVIDTILGAFREVLEINGDPQSPYWLASQMMEMRLCRASEDDVRAALAKDIGDFGERSQFVKV